MIDDGYYLTHEIIADECSLRVVYRPALRRERYELANRLHFLNDDRLARECYAAEIEKRVWNIADVPTGASCVRAPLLDAVLGIDPKNPEGEDAENLREGLRLELENPGLAKVSCNECRKFWMDPLTGQTVIRGGRKMERPDYARLLCETARGCPKGHYSNPKGLSAKNRKAMRHYLECRAVGKFPDDAIVRNNAKIIARVLGECGKRFSFLV